MLVLMRGTGILYPFARGAFRIGATLQAVAIVELGMALGHIPVDNFYQTLNLCAFLIAVLFLAVEWKYHFVSTAVAHFPLVFVMTLAAATERHSTAALADSRGGKTWLAIHIVLVLAGYASLAAHRGRLGLLSDSGAPPQSQETRCGSWRSCLLWRRWII